MKMWSVRSTMFALACTTASPPVAGTPAEALLEYFDRAFTVLDDPRMWGDERAEARERAFWDLADAAIDFAEAALRALGRHWDDRTPQEREYFAQLFAEPVKHTDLRTLASNGRGLPRAPSRYRDLTV